MLCMFWLLHRPAISLPLLGLPCSLRHNNTEIRPIIIPTMAPKYSSERKSCRSLTLNQKLEMMTLSEEGTCKAETGWKLGLCCQIGSQVVRAKDEFLKEMKSAAPVNTRMIRKRKSLMADMEKVFLVWREEQTSHSIHPAAYRSRSNFNFQVLLLKKYIL